MFLKVSRGIIQKNDRESLDQSSFLSEQESPNELGKTKSINALMFFDQVLVIQAVHVVKWQQLGFYAKEEAQPVQIGPFMCSLMGCIQLKL